MIEYLSRLNTKAFAIAALEELVVLLSVTCYVLAGGTYALPLWSALFMAFAVHLLVHVGQAMVGGMYRVSPLHSCWCLMLPTDCGASGSL